MLILPAIDLRDGQCVRLKQGDYAQETVFSQDPVAMAKRWVQEGATYLHLVDLDGARAGHPVNGESIRKIVQAGGVPCQLGGGLRGDAHITEALNWGVQRVVLGTRALQDPAWVREVSHRFPSQVALGIDAKDGRVATQGWLKVSESSALDVARQFAGWPLAALIYTDIGRDGMMKGPNLEAMEEMVKATPLRVIASGGVTEVEDVRRLARIGVAGCIIGRALYEGKIDLAAALQAAKDEEKVESRL